MIEWPIIFVSGLLGSSHCIGMCGPFAALLGSTTTGWQQNICWQILYSFGRIFTYAFLGTLAGFGGQRLVGATIYGINATAILAFVAGGFLIYEGLVAAGVGRRFFPAQGASACSAVGLFRSMLQQRSRWGVFLAGIATGFLPCGLVYAFLLIAARTGNLFHGAMVMVLFGAGTMPVMVATGASASLIRPIWRSRLFAFAGWCVVLMGLSSLYRGWTFLNVADPVACPFCQ